MRRNIKIACIYQRGIEYLEEVFANLTPHIKNFNKTCTVLAMPKVAVKEADLPIIQ
ncbi:MAG: hypothetical protein QM571_07540 [Micrococcaceae bacterium]